LGIAATELRDEFGLGGLEERWEKREDGKKEGALELGIRGGDQRTRLETSFW